MVWHDISDHSIGIFLLVARISDLKVKVERVLDHRVIASTEHDRPLSQNVFSQNVFIAFLPVSDQDIPVTSSIALYTTVDIDFRRGGCLKTNWQC